MFVDRREGLAFTLSGITVALFIIAVIVFIKYGAGWGFYGTIVLAFAIGFTNAWVISKMEPVQPRNAPRQPASRRSHPGGRRRKR